MSERLYQLVEIAVDEQVTEAVNHIQSQARPLANKELKLCSKCCQIREKADYYDPALGGGVGGYGRVCMICKGSKTSSQAGKTIQRRFRKNRR
jgi:hypothetical protein